jgi:Sec-independent protein secretion pathway component TatC
MPRAMAWKRKVAGGILAAIGFMLSPLSWWNDLFVNVPLALVFAWSVSLIYRPAFEPCLIIGYWLTNVLGFFLMHKGTQQMTSEKKPYSRRDLLKDLAISLAYTMLIVILIVFGVLKPFKDYFSTGGAP